MRSWRSIQVGLVCLLSLKVNAQQVPDPAGLDIALERARIQGQQVAIQLTFDTESRSCYAYFAVNDCLAKQRALRREKLDDLRRQEIELNQIQRARRVQEQLTRIRGKLDAD
jgi:colicin import membrane protein